MRGYIGLTDPDWYRYLSVQRELDDVNFWQPHGGKNFRVLEPGQPFLFKLRAPEKKIAGFGFFAGFERLPAWLAWKTFGTTNGAPDFESMIDRIVRLRREEVPASQRRALPIGCIMITAPVFFPEDQWVEPPTDWAPTGIQKGKSYDLTRGEGERVFHECLARAQEARLQGRYWNVDVPAEELAEGLRFGRERLVRPRLGQGTFSSIVRRAYDGACAVTREHSLPVLEAAHIRPYSEGGLHQPENGLLLRSDVHQLFDLGYVTVSPDYRFRVGESLGDEYHNGRIYYELQDKEIALPERIDEQPSRELLDWHGRTIFKG